MATRPKNSSSNVSSVTFHRKTFGQNIQLDTNALKANRHTSFDNGITFSSNPIKPDERIVLKVIDTDDTRQWLGSLAVGFTQIDPSTIAQDTLNRSALPTLCTQRGNSYIKRIFETLNRENVITFYYNQNGAFYVLDGKEHELNKQIDSKKPVWAVIDIYGNVRGVELTTAPKKISDAKAFFAKFPEKPDQLPIRHFTQLSAQNLQTICFCHIHGTEVDLYCQSKVALRKNLSHLVRPYVFVDLPMTPGDELYLRILSIDSNYRTAGVLGFTTAKPPSSTDELLRLPASDPAALVDRSEFWILAENVFEEKMNELDELRIVIDKLGEIYLWRNTKSDQSKKLIAFADPKVPFYPFLFLNGRINALSIVGLISDKDKSNKTKQTPAKNPANEDSGLCQICYTDKANCVLIPCGHMFFCMDCKDDYEEKSTIEGCPVCREPYTDGIEIAQD